VIDGIIIAGSVDVANEPRIPKISFDEGGGMYALMRLDAQAQAVETTAAGAVRCPAGGSVQGSQD